jgi:hypothetical protein
MGHGYDEWEAQRMAKSEDLNKAFNPKLSKPVEESNQANDAEIKRSSGFMSQSFGEANKDLVGQFINHIATHPNRHDRLDSQAGPIPRARHLAGWMKQKPGFAMKVLSPNKLAFAATRHGTDQMNPVGHDEVLQDTWLFEKGKGLRHVRRQAVKKRIS